LKYDFFGYYKYPLTKATGTSIKHGGSLLTLLKQLHIQSQWCGGWYFFMDTASSERILLYNTTLQHRKTDSFFSVAHPLQVSMRLHTVVGVTAESLKNYK